MDRLIRDIAAALLAQRWTLATAESCTGGLIGAAITDLPGSSAWYLGGVVAYSNALKMKWLYVPLETITTHGAVSSQTAQAMAQGACAATGANCALAITGIAGPAGGTPEKPVGLVYVGTATPTAGNVQEYHFPGTRPEIRAAAAKAACQQLAALLQSPAITN